ncbi:unnamed protein product [Alopecurus aequalis]
MASVHTQAPPQFGVPRQHVAAVILVPDDGSDIESVAESSSPCPHRPTASGGGECDEDDDGCSSCVEGDEPGYYREADVDEEGEEVSTASVWWKKRLAASWGDGGVFPPAVEVEDPERAAARQAEDRKFWEDCLGTGYP